MADLKKLLNARGKSIKDARAILEAAEKENRDLTADEQVKYDAHFEDGAKAKRAIDQETELREQERELAATDLETRELNPSVETPEEKRDVKLMAQFRDMLNGKPMGAEMRALQADKDIAGGYIVAPEQFAQSIIQEKDNMTFIRGIATVIPVMNTNSLGAPSLDADPEDGTWTSEIGAVDEDSEMKFGKRELIPHQLAKLVKISEKLMRNAAIPVEQLVQARMGYKFGITEEKAFLTGSGAQQPLGLFTASDNGISTDRDISTDMGTASITSDGVLSVKYGIKAQYRPKAKWLFHRDAIKQIAKLKDGAGQYMWRPGLSEDQPDTLSGHGIMESEYAPNTFTSGLYVGLFGDFSYYWIADSLMFGIQRLNELFSLTNQIGFKGLEFVDGMPTLESAFARMKTA